MTVHHLIVFWMKMFCQICGEWFIGVHNFSPGLFCQLCKVLHRHSDPKFRISFKNCWGKSRTFLQSVFISNAYNSFLKNQKLCSSFLGRSPIWNIQFWILNIQYLLFFLHASTVEKIKTVIQNSTLLNRWAAGRSLVAYLPQVKKSKNCPTTSECVLS